VHKYSCFDQSTKLIQAASCKFFFIIHVSLANIPIGTWIHNIEWNPGQGAKLIRAAGTFAQIIKKFENMRFFEVYLTN
jgi:ribosomal protein L2